MDVLGEVPALLSVAFIQARKPFQCRAIFGNNAWGHSGQMRWYQRRIGIGIILSRRIGEGVLRSPYLC